MSSAKTGAVAVLVNGSLCPPIDTVTVSPSAPVSPSQANGSERIVKALGSAASGSGSADDQASSPMSQRCSAAGGVGAGVVGDPPLPPLPPAPPFPAPPAPAPPVPLAPGRAVCWHAASRAMPMTAATASSAALPLILLPLSFRAT